MERERDLVARAVAGDGAAYALLVREHEAAALRVAAREAGPEADDAFQEACVKAWRALDRFDQSRPFGPWFQTIVANEARNRRRAAGRREGLAARAAAADPAGLAAPSAESLALAGAQREELRDALGALAPGEREVVALRHVAGLDEAQTAAVLGVPRGTVKSRLSRGLDRMRAQLGPAVLILALLLGALIAVSPDVRARITDWLGIGAVRVERVDELPGIPTGTLSRLGRPVSAGDAARRIGIPLPRIPSLGAPDAIRADAVAVALAWGARPGLPDGVLLELVRGDGTLLLRKLVEGGASVRAIPAGGVRGHLVPGPHALLVESRSGSVVERPPRLVGDTALWLRAGVTHRLEAGAATARLAASVRP